MLRWSDMAIVLSARPFGEGQAIASVFSRARGRTSGVVRGRRKHAAVLVSGNRVRANFSARLDEHLGSLTLELEASRAAAVMSTPLAAVALQAIVGVSETALPERDPHPAVFDGLDLVLDSLGDSALWPALLVRFELGLLAELGFALDLSRCALTGAMDDLAFVSPRTGRAASRAAGAPFADRLLPLPAFLIEGQGLRAPSEAEIQQGLALTGHFLAAQIYAPLGKPLPQARARLAEALASSPAQSS